MRRDLTSLSRLAVVPLVLFALGSVTGCTTNLITLKPNVSQQKEAQAPQSPAEPPAPQAAPPGHVERADAPPPPSSAPPVAEATPPFAEASVASMPPELASQPMPTTAGPVVDPGGLARVGLLLPLSGASSKIGQALLDAALLAQFELADDRYILQPYDTHGTAEGAIQAAQAAIAQGAQVILGPLFSHSVKAIAPYTQQAGVPVIAFSTDPAATSQGVYITGFLLDEQIDRVVRKAMEQGMKRFAALAPDTPYGRTVVATLGKVLGHYGASPVKVAYYDPTATDQSDVVRRLANYDSRKAALAREKAKLAGAKDEASRAALRRLDQADTFGPVDFDAVLLPDEGGRLRQIASLLPYFDVDPKQVKMLGTMLWHDRTLGKEPALVGGWYAAPPLAPHDAFTERYTAWFGGKPPRIASLAYDAVALTAVMARAPQGAVFDAASLANPSGFSGVDGLFRLLPDGRNERGLAVIEVGPDGLTEIDPGKSSFQGY